MQYKYAVGMKYDLRTKNQSFKKIKYIMDEILSDIRWKNRGSMEWQLGYVQIFFLWFLRIFIHYGGQYFTCKYISKVPVTNFDP
jgi:hypothetical protein